MAAAKTPRLRIGTRGSPLALAQAHAVRDRLRSAHDDLAGDDAIAIVIIKTTGDRILDRPLAAIGGKGLFTKELDLALAEGAVDICVHSMKDVPTVLPDGMAIGAVLPREDPRDAWFSRSGALLRDLPAGSVIGSASLRRQAQILSLRPDLRVETLRGNVATRLDKMNRGVVDATLLALAGLKRLDQVDQATAVFDASEMLPAVAQGVIGLQIRDADRSTSDRLAALHCDATHACMAMERAFLMALDGSCRTPIAGLAEWSGDRLSFAGLVAAIDGSRVERITGTANPADAAEIGRELGRQLRSRLPAGMVPTGTSDG